MLRTLDGLLDRGPWVDLVALGLLAAVAVVKPDLRSVVVVLVAGVVLTAWVRGRDRIAAVTGFFVPIEVIDGISSNVLLAGLIGLLVITTMVYPSTVDRSARNLVISIVVVVVVLADVQRFELVFGSGEGGLRAIASITIGCVAAGFAATRLEARDPLLKGFLAGVAVSSVVGVLQVADISSPRPYPIGDRGPGLAEFTTVQSFNCAAALVIAAYLAYTARSRFDRVLVCALAVACAVGLVVNGAQGGLYSLVMVAAAGAFVGRSRLRSGGWMRTAVPVVAIGVLVVIVPLALGIGIPSVSGLLGDSESGFGNESARLDAARAGVEELLDHPWTGPGSDAYHERHGPAMPHFLPLKAGMVAGVGGFLLGLVVVAGLVIAIVRGPVGRTPVSWMGFGVLVVALARTLTTPDGPFGDTHSMVLFLVAVLAATGARPQPVERGGGGIAARTRTPVRA